MRIAQGVWRGLACVGLALVMVVGSGCQSIPFWPKSYRLDIKPIGSLVGEVSSIYVLVGRQSLVSQPASVPSRWQELIQDDMLNDFHGWAYYHPIDSQQGIGDHWDWKDGGGTNRSVTISLDRDTIEVKVPESVLETDSFNVLVYVITRNGEELQVIENGDLQSLKRQLVDVSASDIILRN